MIIHVTKLFEPPQKTSFPAEAQTAYIKCIIRWQNYMEDRRHLFADSDITLVFRANKQARFSLSIGNALPPYW